MADVNDKLLDHDYDGIKELNNDLPRWWVWLFLITIVWGVIYVIYYHVFGVGYLQIDEYKSEINPYYIRVQESDTKLLGVLNQYHSPFFNPKGDMTPRLKLLGKGGPVFEKVTRESDTLTYVALTDEVRIVKGKETFIKNCATCHGNFGEGGVGPNLTDSYWLHGAGMNNVVKTIKYGVPAKGMISWRGFLKEEQIMEVGSFILTLKGTNPPNTKPPQGELVEDL